MKKALFCSVVFCLTAILAIANNTLAFGPGPPTAMCDDHTFYAPYQVSDVDAVQIQMQCAAVSIESVTPVAITRQKLTAERYNLVALIQRNPAIDDRIRYCNQQRVLYNHDHQTILAFNKDAHRGQWHYLVRRC